MNERSAFLVRPVRVEGRRELGHATPGKAEFPVRLLRRIRQNCNQFEETRRRLLRLGKRGNAAARRELLQRFRLVFIEAAAYEAWSRERTKSGLQRTTAPAAP